MQFDYLGEVTGAEQFVQIPVLPQLVLIPQDTPTPAIFNSSVFFTALALLAVLFTVTDVRFKFRIAVAPLPLNIISYIAIGLIGAATLLLDFADAQHRSIPYLPSYALCQTVCGVAFFGLFLIWLHYGFIAPPRFGRFNSRKFTSSIYHYILRGDVAQMTSLAHELQTSVPKIVSLAAPSEKERRAIAENFGQRPEENQNSTRGDARALMSIIGTRRFCRCVAANAPGTAIAFFQALTEKKFYNVPLRQFAVNVSVEAIENRDSLLHHEDDGYNSGALGQWKPLSQALFGDYKLADALRPFNVPYSLWWSWKAEHWKVYGRCAVITISDYIRRARWGYRSRALDDIFEAFEHSLMNVGKVDGADSEAGYGSDPFKRLEEAVSFVKNVFDELSKLNPPPKPVSRNTPNDYHSHDLYDWTAKLIYQIIVAASRVRRGEMVWTVQYNTVWSPIFDLGEGKASTIIQRKVMRLLVKEIAKWDYPNYLSSRLIGMVLNCVSIKSAHRKDSWSGDQPLNKFMRSWARKNLMVLWEKNPEVMEWGLPDNLTINGPTRRLVRTFAKNLERKPKIIYWQLD